MLNDFIADDERLIITSSDPTTVELTGLALATQASFALKRYYIIVLSGGIGTVPVNPCPSNGDLTMLYNIIRVIYRNCFGRGQVGLFALDLGKAFDIVNNAALKLRLSDYDVNLNWLKSYLNERSQISNICWKFFEPIKSRDSRHTHTRTHTTLFF